MSITSLDHDAKVTATMDALKQKGCVLFVGAGISISPPAGLPNWHNLRDWTLEAVGNQDVNLQSYLPKLTELDMIGSPGRKGMTPELVASVILSVCPNYFDSLEVLDDGSPNENHVLIALLAKLGLIRYIITTNFDLPLLVLSYTNLLNASISSLPFSTSEDGKNPSILNSQL